MIKYFTAAFMFLANNEVVSWLALTAIAVMFLGDVAKARLVVGE